MPSKKRSTASSSKNISIGGDVVDSAVFIGDNNVVNYFKGEYISLKEHYVSPDSVFQRVRTEDFVGRDWLTVQVDAFLNDPLRKSGAFLLIGDAGVGKTSFMAHLVKERGYLHLFAEQAPGQAMLQRAIQSLGSQLVTRYQIDPYKDRDTLIQGTVFPDFLERLLRMAASKLTGGEKIVIVCDALDEAGTFPDGNVFGLPNVLPDGVYLILSQRPVNVKLPNLEPEVVHLEAQGKENLQDMEIYLRAVAKRSEVAGQIQAKEYSEDFFVQTLKEKSLGVWMYLHYVIKEIERGQRAPLDLKNLPKGLVGYYSDYWDNWRSGRKGIDSSKWDSLYAPLLATLAAAQQAVAIETLIEWSDVQANSSEVHRLLDESWSAFIAKKEEKGKAVYALYHQSLRDFITGKIDTKKLPPTHANLVNDLSKKKVEAHQRILKVFEMECNGQWEKLVERKYPRLHLSAHLNGAGEYETLRILLTEGDEKIKWADAREQKEETYAGYLNDLSYVWAYAEREQNYALAIRCMLIENSIHSLAANIPPELLVELVKEGMWGYERCLSIIRQKTNPYDQAVLLKFFAPSIPLQLHKEALLLASEIKDEIFRANALSALVPHLNNELKLRALSAAYTIQDKYALVYTLVALAPYLSEELKSQALQDALAATHNIYKINIRVYALSILLPHLSMELKTQILQEALSTAHNIYKNTARVYALSILAPYLNGDLKLQVIQEALTVAHDIKDKSAHARALFTLMPHLSDELKSQVLQEALAATREIKDEIFRAETLIDHLSHVSGDLKIQVLQETLSVTREIKNQRVRDLALSNLPVHLIEKHKIETFQKALSVAREIQSRSKYALALLTLVPYLNENLIKETIQEVLSVTHLIQNNPDRAIVLSTLAQHLSKELKSQVLREALSAVREIDDFQYEFTLSALSQRLNGKLKEQVFPQEVLSVTYETQDEYTNDNIFSTLHYLEETLYASIDNIYEWDDLFNTWKEIEFEGLEKHLIPVIKIASQKDRKVGAKVVDILTPALVHFSGEEIVPALYRAIQDTARWWP